MPELTAGRDKSFIFYGCTPDKEVPLVTLISDQIIHMGITEIQVAFGASDPKDLPALAKACFGVNLFEGQIHRFRREFTKSVSPKPHPLPLGLRQFESDQDFAEAFGYKIAPSFAFLRLIRQYHTGGRLGQSIEAWISPALIHIKHPLYNFDKQNALALFKQSKEVSALPTGSETMVMLGFGEVTPKHYLRLRVLDEPGALAQVCEVIGKANINIAGVLQNESTDDISTTAAFIIRRSPTVRFQQMIDKLHPLTMLPTIEP